MSSLIEQAAIRLEQLRRAGAQVKGVPPSERMPGGGPQASPEQEVQGLDHAVSSRQIEIDLAAAAAAGVLLPSAPRTALADQFRVIKRPLVRNATGRGAAKVPNGNLIMVTSALVGEGKTFTAVNLAMSLAAEVDHRVMLVDADVERPSVARKLGLVGDGGAAPQLGLLDVLDGRAEMSEVILRTNIDKFSLVPSGTHRRHATELLASDTMMRLLQQMASRYADRIIVFDSPPLLLTTEARVLATHMGQVVVVVHAGKTPQAKVESALDMIESCPIRLLVLNHARATEDAGYGYGSYGYGAGGAQAANDNIPPETV
jgi:exopolysaccharide/PEP-CTERM locus tyrosine autokinase